MDTSKPLAGKVCMVTGGTRGIGLAITRMLLSEGCSVAVCARTEASISYALAAVQAESPSKLRGKIADVSDYDQVRDLFRFVDREFGGLDVLVNNAGIGRFGKVSETKPEDWAAILGTNLTGTFYCSREALFRFGKRDGGDIVNLGSLAGKNPFAGGAAYNASKFGLNGFAEALMLESRHEKVRVSTVCPGSVNTEFGGGGGSKEPNGPDSGANAWKVQPEDVAEIVRMLLRMPGRTMVSYVEVRPSRPPRR